MDREVIMLITDRLDSIEEKVDKVDTKVDKVHSDHAKLDKSFSIFKIKAYVLISILVSAKETLMKKFLG